MKKSIQTLKMVLVFIVVGIIITLLCNAIKTDPFKSYQKISAENILNNAEDESYYVYFYKTNCPYCENIESAIRDYAKAHSTLYFVNIEENKEKFKSFDWKTFHSKNDIEIGKINNGKIEFYVNESEKKYTQYNQTDIYGKVKRYKIVEADEDYIKLNKNAKKGYVYASLQTPNIDYYNLTSKDRITLAGVPTMLHVTNGKIDQFYFDDVEIGSLMERLNH